MNTIILTCGVPCAGATTWAKKKAGEEDLIYIGTKEEFDTLKQSKLLKVKDTFTPNIVVDGAELSEDSIMGWKEYANSVGFKLKVFVFNTRTDICIERNAAREEEEERISEEEILNRIQDLKDIHSFLLEDDEREFDLTIISNYKE